VAESACPPQRPLSRSSSWLVGAGRDCILRAEEPVDVVTKDDAVLLALYRRLSTSQRALLWHMAAYMGTAAMPDRWNASTGCTYRLTPQTGPQTLRSSLRLLVWRA
jgi:hypothetical protein